jgi:ABC-type transporter Mla subunit MlaD
MNPLFWLGLSILLVAASLTAVLVAAIPALQELARAARSAEKLFDTLSRELPPTLNAIRNTSLEITDLTDDVSEGVKSASQVVKQADQSLDSARKQAQNIQVSTRSVLVGIKTAWRTFTRLKTNKRNNIERLPINDQPQLTLREREMLRQENRRTELETHRNNNGYSKAVNWENDFNEENLISTSAPLEDWSD